MMTRKGAISTVIGLLVVALVIFSGFTGYLLSRTSQIQTETQTLLVTSVSTQTVIQLGETTTTTEMILTRNQTNVYGTITRDIVVEYVGGYTVTISGNCTLSPGTIAASSVGNYTTMIFPTTGIGSLVAILNSTDYTMSTNFSTVTENSVTVINGSTVTTMTYSRCPLFA